MKKIYLSLIFLFTVLFFTSEVEAASVSLSANKVELNKGDQFTVTATLSDASVATLTLRINVDTSKVEYVSGPANSSFSAGRAIYTWTDPNGGASPKTGGSIATFTFRAKETGSAVFSVTGEFYTPEETELDPSFSGVTISIVEKPAPAPVPQVDTTPQTPPPSTPVTQAYTPSSNSYLKSLSLDRAGMSPVFNKLITTYSLVVPSDVVSIDVLATKEDANAEVFVTGNTNLQDGLNRINIVVTAEDGTKRTYVINVTKTDNIEEANANLENLAVDGYLLTPDFNYDMTNYSIEINNEIDKLNILAVPKNPNATIVIVGNENLIPGESIITITVTAEDKITEKVYEINVKKKTSDEEFANILLFSETNNNSGNSRLTTGTNLIVILVSIAGVVIAGIGIYIIYTRYYKR